MIERNELQIVTYKNHDLDILDHLFKKYCYISNMQKIGKSHQSYVPIQQWHVMYYLS